MYKGSNYDKMLQLPEILTESLNRRKWLIIRDS